METIMELGKVYHLYDHAVHKNNIFVDADNYRYFLSRYIHYLSGVVDTMAYCLMPNHFHFVIRVKTRDQILTLPMEILVMWKISANSTDYDIQRRVGRQFANLFNAYAQALNKQQSRKGALFNAVFSRKLIDNKIYFQNVICYVHHNAVHHGFCEYFGEWFYSSYKTLVLNDLPVFLKRDLVLNSFGGIDAFIEMHKNWKQKSVDEFV